MKYLILCPIFLFMMLPACVFSDVGNDKSSVKVGVLGFGVLHVPNSHVLAVDAAVNNVDVAFVLSREKREPGRYSSISFSRDSTRLENNKRLTLEDTVCGVDVYSLLPNARDEGVSLLFFEAGDLQINVSAVGLEQAMELVRFSLRSRCLND